MSRLVVGLDGMESGSHIGIEYLAAICVVCCAGAGDCGAPVRVVLPRFPL